jgi:hypothetical protein
MDEKNPTREEVLALYGNAMHAAQDFEEAVVGLLGVRTEVSIIERAASDELDPAYREWGELLTWPTGRVSNALRLQSRLTGEVQRALAARNLLAHHYLRDHSRHLESACQRAGMARRLRESANRFREVQVKLAAEGLAALHAAGLADDHASIAGEAHLLRCYDPALDADVPPEPFADHRGLPT